MKVQHNTFGEIYIMSSVYVLKTMYLYASLFQGFASAVHEVHKIDHHILRTQVSRLINNSKCYQESNDIAEKALTCLQEKYQGDFQSNCEVIVDLQNIGRICVKSGFGAYKVAVIGDIVDCEAIVLEYQISTSEITGLLIDSLFRFCSSMPVHILNELGADYIKQSFNDAKEFVQKNQHLDWRNANLDFNGIFPLNVISGKGEMMSNILEIQKELMKTDTGHLNERRQNNIDIKISKFDARELGKLRLRYCGNEGVNKTEVQHSLEKQFVALTDFYKQTQTEKYWQKCVVEIFNGNKVYNIFSGDKTKQKIVVVMFEGHPKVSLC